MEYGTGRYVTMYTVPVRGRARRLRGRDGLSLRRPTVARRPPCHVARSRTVVLCVPLFDTDYHTLSPRTIVLYNNYTGHTRYTTRLYWLSWPSKYQYNYKLYGIIIPVSVLPEPEAQLREGGCREAAPNSCSTPRPDPRRVVQCSTLSLSAISEFQGTVHATR